MLYLVTPFQYRIHMMPFYIQFPWELDIEPYTAAGISHREKAEDDATAMAPTPILYELVGVVVHSGQASAGHYYTFRKGKR